MRCCGVVVCQWFQSDDAEDAGDAYGADDADDADDAFGADDADDADGADDA